MTDKDVIKLSNEEMISLFCPDTNSPDLCFSVPSLNQEDGVVEWSTPFDNLANPYVDQHSLEYYDKNMIPHTTEMWEVKIQLMNAGKINFFCIHFDDVVDLESFKKVIKYLFNYAESIKYAFSLDNVSNGIAIVDFDWYIYRGGRYKLDLLRKDTSRYIRVTLEGLPLQFVPSTNNETYNFKNLYILYDNGPTPSSIDIFLHMYVPEEWDGRSRMKEYVDSFASIIPWKKWRKFRITNKIRVYDAVFSELGASPYPVAFSINASTLLSLL